MVYCYCNNTLALKVFIEWSNLPLCIYNYTSFLPVVWKLQIAIKLDLCWKMCTLTTRQLQRMWPKRLQEPCKTMVVEDIPSTTLKNKYTCILNGLTQPEKELSQNTVINFMHAHPSNQGLNMWLHKFQFRTFLMPRDLAQP